MTPEPHEHLPPRTPGADAHAVSTSDEELFRDSLRRTVDPLSLPSDLVPEAVREGYRRRARSRAYTVAGAFVAVTGLTLGLSVLGPRLLPGPDREPASPVVPSLSLPAPTPTPSPRRTEPRPDMPSPTATPIPPGPPTPSLSAPPVRGSREARRPEDFRQQASGTLDALLPASVGTVLPVGGDPTGYQARRGSVVRAVHLAVHPEAGSAAPVCRDLPEKGLTCENIVLDDGTPARVHRHAGEGRTGTEVSIHYRYGRSTVSLSVSPAPAGAGDAPVTAGDLLRVVQSPRFRELIAYADENPVPWSGAAA
ncbi:hypothetical protein [Streptomyces sp. V2I9]|uniref:hypothetical protein n=1 Tax=Streptomyces sp. V2I9 TaxID=3042304 RepID=UPI0027839DA6|nr:hypothetical protein [Streptomyces sp. V2I9]MDQ0986228.1 hypothetical protein [Streptomyces sp. V2I9]